MLKKTKIVATIGPRTESTEMLKKIHEAGVNVARLNMSHGDHAEHKQKIQNIKEVNASGGSIAILMDLSGPKIRTGEYKTERITIEKGKTLILTSEKIIGDEKRIYINYEKLPQEVKKGSIIMLDDGKKKLEVQKIVGNDIYCKILVGGELKSRRGVNVPGAYLSIKSFTDKDRKDLAFGLKEGIDIVAFSFVRSAEDVRELRAVLKKNKKNLPIIVKIETQEAIDNLDEILLEADGAMVARGDLAIEVPTELVPIYQKDIIEKCNALGKPVITATQMLESMIHSPVPTRAEVSDIANAIYDGTDAVMLSEESTLGSFPLEAIEVMSRVAKTIEASEESESFLDENITTADTISEAVWKVSKDVGAAYIVALTESGSSAKMVSRFKPSAPIIALSPNEGTVKHLELSYGVKPFLIKKLSGIDESMTFIPAFLKAKKLGKKGDKVVVTAGVPFNVSGSTNLLFVLTL